jgi:hypothetical protein
MNDHLKKIGSIVEEHQYVGQVLWFSAKTVLKNWDNILFFIIKWNILTNL